MAIIALIGMPIVLAYNDICLLDISRQGKLGEHSY